jgi:hypothetical protein
MLERAISEVAKSERQAAGGTINSKTTSFSYQPSAIRLKD